MPTKIHISSSGSERHSGIDDDSGVHISHSDESRNYSEDSAASASASAEEEDYDLVDDDDIGPSDSASRPRTRAAHRSEAPLPPKPPRAGHQPRRRAATTRPHDGRPPRAPYPGQYPDEAAYFPPEYPEHRRPPSDPESVAGQYWDPSYPTAREEQWGHIPHAGGPPAAPSLMSAHPYGAAPPPGTYHPNPFAAPDRGALVQVPHHDPWAYAAQQQWGAPPPGPPPRGYGHPPPPHPHHQPHPSYYPPPNPYPPPQIAPGPWAWGVPSPPAPPEEKKKSTDDEGLAALRAMIKEQEENRVKKEKEIEERLADAAKKKKEAEDRAAELTAAVAKAKEAAEKEAEAKAKKAKEDHESETKKAKEEADKALEEAKKAAEAAKKEAESLKPDPKAYIHFKDAVGRKFSFPWNICKTWSGMEDLILQAFLHVDKIGPEVQKRHYDLMGPNNEIILPPVWETVVEPGWNISMHMWQMPEPEKKKEKDPLDSLAELLGPLPDPKEKKGKKGKKARPQSVAGAGAIPPPPDLGGLDLDALLGADPLADLVLAEDKKKKKKKEPEKGMIGWFAGGSSRRKKK